MIKNSIYGNYPFAVWMGRIFHPPEFHLHYIHIHISSVLPDYLQKTALFSFHTKNMNYLIKVTHYIINDPKKNKIHNAWNIPIIYMNKLPF